MEGSFVHSLVLTDVASGWTECIALPVREQTLIVEAVDGLRARLPFPVLGIDTDDDSAFLNDTLFNYCNDQDITLTRSILISPSIVFCLVKRRCYAAIRCVSQRVLAARYARASARLWTGCPLWPLTHLHRMRSRAFSSTSSVHSSRCCNSAPLRFRHPWRCHRKTNVHIPLIRYSESDRSSTSDPADSDRSASTAVSNSISSMVVQGFAPDISHCFLPWISTAPHPQVPGLPMAEPSVKIRTIAEHSKREVNHFFYPLCAGGSNDAKTKRFGRTVQR
jgi:hypothetical protein